LAAGLSKAVRRASLEALAAYAARQFHVTIDAKKLRRARTRKMSDYDPGEMVKFDNKDVSLWTAVHDIISRPAVKRTGTAVFRAEGKKPSILDAADIESIAQLPAFQGPQPPAFNED
jgi:hypothetical protein